MEENTVPASPGEAPPQELCQPCLGRGKARAVVMVLDRLWRGRDVLSFVPHTIRRSMIRPWLGHIEAGMAADGRHSA